MQSVLLDLRWYLKDAFQVNPEGCVQSRIQRESKFLSSGKEILQSKLSRKTSKIIYAWSVPQTDTGVQVEKTKANGWVLPKELGKKATVTSG